MKRQYKRKTNKKDCAKANNNITLSPEALKALFNYVNFETINKYDPVYELQRLTEKYSKKIWNPIENFTFVKKYPRILISLCFLIYLFFYFIENSLGIKYRYFSVVIVGLLFVLILYPLIKAIIVWWSWPNIKFLFKSTCSLFLSSCWLGCSFCLSLTFLADFFYERFKILEDAINTSYSGNISYLAWLNEPQSNMVFYLSLVFITSFAASYVLLKAIRGRLLKMHRKWEFIDNSFIVCYIYQLVVMLVMIYFEYVVTKEPLVKLNTLLSMSVLGVLGVFFTFNLIFLMLGHQVTQKYLAKYGVLLNLQEEIGLLLSKQIINK